MAFINTELASFELSLDLILRVGVFGCFFGHGFLAAMGNQGWNKYLRTVGMSGSLGRLAMRVIGVMDIAIAFITLLFKPNPAITTWAALWAFSTALIRPLSGEEIWAFVERAGNWATPLALLWTQLQASGAADPLVKQALALLPAAAPLPFAPATPFLEHMLAALVVAIALFIVSLTFRLVNGKGETA